MNEAQEALADLAKMDREMFLFDAPAIDRQATALNSQVAGDHYKKYKIQPTEYIVANGMSFLAGNCIKYVTRYKDKGGAEDIRKAIHYLNMILEFEYSEKQE